MKKNVLNAGLGLLSIFLLLSCMKDGKDVYISYGVIQNVISDNNYEIRTDIGSTLIVQKSLTTQSVENDKRVLVNFEILSDKDKNKKVYDVSVNGFYQLLSKPVVPESFILEDEEIRRDSIGNDPFNQINAGFGGDYINIDFEVWHAQFSDVKHLINLVYDDTRADSDTLYLKLYHNAYGETPGKNLSLHKGIGRSSFKISDLLPQGVTSMPVNITWTEYFYYNEVRERSSTGIFKLGDKIDNNVRLEKQISIDSSIGIK